MKRSDTTFHCSRGKRSSWVSALCSKSWEGDSKHCHCNDHPPHPWSIYSAVSNTWLPSYKEEQPKDCSGRDYYASLVDRRKWVWDHVTMPGRELVLGIKVITLLVFWAMWEKTQNSCLEGHATESTLPPNCGICRQDSWHRLVLWSDGSTVLFMNASLHSCKLSCL